MEPSIRVGSFLCDTRGPEARNAMRTTTLARRDSSWIGGMWISGEALFTRCDPLFQLFFLRRYEVLIPVE